MENEYRAPYPTWILVGMDVLAAGILMASFRDAWSVVKSLGAHADTLANAIVAGAVVLAIDATILLLEQVRSHVKIRGGKTWASDGWVLALIIMSAILNVRYLTQTVNIVDQSIGAILGIAIPSTIAVLGFVKGDMLAYNARLKRETAVERSEQTVAIGLAGSAWSLREAPGPQRAASTPIARAAAEKPDAETSPLFRLRRKAPAEATS